MSYTNVNSEKENAMYEYSVNPELKENEFKHAVEYLHKSGDWYHVIHYFLIYGITIKDLFNLVNHIEAWSVYDRHTVFQRTLYELITAGLKEELIKAGIKISNYYQPDNENEIIVEYTLKDPNSGMDISFSNNFKKDSHIYEPFLNGLGMDLEKGLNVKGENQAYPNEVADGTNRSLIPITPQGELLTEKLIGEIKNTTNGPLVWNGEKWIAKNEYESQNGAELKKRTYSQVIAEFWILDNGVYQKSGFGPADFGVHSTYDYCEDQILYIRTNSSSVGKVREIFLNFHEPPFESIFSDDYFDLFKIDKNVDLLRKLPETKEWYLTQAKRSFHKIKNMFDSGCIVVENKPFPTRIPNAVCLNEAKHRSPIEIDMERSAEYQVILEQPITKTNPKGEKWSDKHGNNFFFVWTGTVAITIENITTLGTMRNLPVEKETPFGNKPVILGTPEFEMKMDLARANLKDIQDQRAKLEADIRTIPELQGKAGDALIYMKELLNNIIEGDFNIRDYIKEQKIGLADMQIAKCKEQLILVHGMYMTFEKMYGEYGEKAVQAKEKSGELQNTHDIDPAETQALPASESTVLPEAEITNTENFTEHINGIIKETNDIIAKRDTKNAKKHAKQLRIQFFKEWMYSFIQSGKMVLVFIILAFLIWLAINLYQMFN